MSLKIENSGVSEIISTAILLGIAVAIFSVMYITVLSQPGPSPQALVTIVGEVKSNTSGVTGVVFEHRGGQKLGLDTKVILALAGVKQPMMTIDTLLDNASTANNSLWRIGEQAVYNGRFKNAQIEATIVDPESNSIVFYGILQKGYVIPPYGRGGIWHFNESHWNGTPGEVKDSSGNENHGTSYNGANTTKIGALVNKSGSFDGIDDYVEVPDSYGLDITNQITVEAWIKSVNMNQTGISELKYKFGYAPYITYVKNDLYVVVSEDQSKKGIINTLNITRYGKASDMLDSYMPFGSPPTANGNDMSPVITQVSNNTDNSTFIVTYTDENRHLHLKTFNISLANTFYGKIFYSGKELVLTDTSAGGNNPNRPSIIKISDNVFAIAYWSSSDNGTLKTVEVFSNNGTILPYGNTIPFDRTYAREPSIIYVGGNTYAIVYRNASNNGILKTFTIYPNNGTKIPTGQSSQLDNTCFEPTIVHVDNGLIFAIAYRGPSNNGIIKTYNIYSTNGSIQTTRTNKTLGGGNCYNPCLIYQTNNYYVLTYADDDSGHSNSIIYRIIEIANDGSIPSVGPVKSYIEKKCFTPFSIKISNRVFAVVYETQAHGGSLITFLAECPSLVYSSGIYKYGSYGIYANYTNVVVNINTKTINASIVPNSWNYVVLTYDKDAASQQMKLYVNGVLRTYRTLTDTIQITDSNLLFGDLFYGLIDEVAIHDKALNISAIQYHFQHPGFF